MNYVNCCSYSTHCLHINSFRFFIIASLFTSFYAHVWNLNFSKVFLQFYERLLHFNIWFELNNKPLQAHSHQYNDCDEEQSFGGILIESDIGYFFQLQLISKFLEPGFSAFFVDDTEEYGEAEAHA